MRIVTLLIVVSLFGCNNRKPTEKGENTSVVRTKEEIKETPKEEESLASWRNPEITKLSVNGYFPQFVPNSNAIIYSAKNYEGLWLLDLVTDQVKQLTDKKGAGYQPMIVENKIIYEVKSRLSYLEEVDLSTGEMQKVDREYARYSPNEYANLLNEQPVSVALSDDLLALEIKWKNGEIRKMTPKGSKNYISVALSPNQSNVLYKVAGLGAFISNLDGEEIQSLGDVDHPSWINENQIVYAISKDDGMQSLSSDVFIYDLKEEKEYNVSQAIDEHVENPKANTLGDMLIMNSQSGAIYLIKKLN